MFYGGDTPIPYSTSDYSRLFIPYLPRLQALDINFGAELHKAGLVMMMMIMIMIMIMIMVTVTVKVMVMVMVMVMMRRRRRMWMRVWTNQQPSNHTSNP